MSDDGNVTVTFRDITVGIVCPILGFVGLVLNCISIYVFKINRLDHKHHYFRYLLYKSTLDSIFLAIYSFDTLVEFICFDAIGIRLPVTFRLPLIYYFNGLVFTLAFLVCASAMCEVAAALDRLFIIGQMLVNCYQRVSPILVLILLLVVSGLTHIHTLFMFNKDKLREEMDEYDADELYSENSTSTIDPREITDLLDMKIYEIDVWSWFIYWVLITAILIVINILLCHLMHKRMAQKKAMAEQQYERLNATLRTYSNNSRTTTSDEPQQQPSLLHRPQTISMSERAKQNVIRMVVGTTLVSSVGRIVYFVSHYGNFYRLIFEYVNPVLSCIYIMSYSLDFFVYYFFNFIFQQCINEMIQPCVCKKLTTAIQQTSNAEGGERSLNNAVNQQQELTIV